MTIKVRVGVPVPNGRLLEAARERGYPVLLSANAFYRGIVPPGHPGRDFGEKRFWAPQELSETSVVIARNYWGLA